MTPITRVEMFLAKAAGEDVTTPKPITRIEMFLQNLIDHIRTIGGGGSGKSAYEYAQDGGYTGTEEEFSAKLAEEGFSGNWNDLTDKPFGEKTVTVTNDIEDFTPILPNDFGKISDLVIPKQSIVGMVVRSENIDFAYTLTESDLERGNVSDDLFVTEAFIVAYSPGATYNDCVYPEVGIYMVSTEHFGRMILEWKELAPLDEKYIPDTIARTADVSTMINEALGVIENGTY